MNLVKKGLFFLGIFAITIVPLASFAQSPDEAFLEGEAEELFGEDAFQPSESSYYQEPLVESGEVKGRITEIVSESEFGNVRHALFKVESAEGEEFLVNTQESFTEGLRYHIKVGDVVYLQVIRSTEDGSVVAAFLANVRRTPALATIFVLFFLVILAVGWLRGFSSIIGLAITMGILFFFIFPQILSGADPVLVTIIGSVVILAVNMHLSHGFNRGTVLAFASTCIGLILVYVFGSMFVNVADLSGLASEEAILLYYNHQDIILPSGILLAGIILGAVGVLDDIAITQGETIAELIDANPKLTRRELFTRAMRVGRHHIASTVNTLVLAYAGVAMPLLLLFLSTNEISFIRFINEEPVAEEIIRTLAGTMALVLTVPISTFLATFVKRD